MAANVKSTRGFAKGNPGKPKGATNKTTREVKEMILQALEGAGGVEYLIQRASDPRTASAFLTLVGKVLPLQVTDADGGPVQTVVTRIEIVPLQPK
jgi:hypothetical protein